MNIYIGQASALLEAWHSTTKEGLSEETVENIDTVVLDLKRLIGDIPADQTISTQEVQRAFFVLVGMMSYYCPFILLPAVIGFSTEIAIDSDLEAIQDTDRRLWKESWEDANRDGFFSKFDEPFIGKVKDFLKSILTLQKDKKFTGKTFTLLSGIYSSWIGRLVGNRLPVDLGDIPLYLPTFSD